jgi:hypothetical protein
MARQPSQCFGVIAEHGVDRLAGRNLALDGVEKADEFAVAGTAGRIGEVRLGTQRRPRPPPPAGALRSIINATAHHTPRNRWFA